MSRTRARGGSGGLPLGCAGSAGERGVEMRAIRIGGTVIAALACAAAALPALAAAQTPVPPTTPVPPALPPGVIAAGVNIAGVQVGGLARAAARDAVIAQYVAPRRAKLPVTFRGRTLAIDPLTVGYVADVDYALDGALLFGRSKAVPPEGAGVPLRQKVDRKRLRAVISLRASKNDIPAKDATLSFSGANPVVSKPRVGIAIDVPKASDRRSSRACWSATSPPCARLQAACSRPGHLGRAGDHHPAQRLPAHALARGQAPRASRSRWASPPPDAQRPCTTSSRSRRTRPGSRPARPGPPGWAPCPPASTTRWDPLDGTSAPAIGIHGTPIASSIGTAASHGCIRMHISDAEYLYDQIDVGTPVKIR